MVYLSIILISFISGVVTLKLRNISIPAVVIRGHAVKLGCYFDLEGLDKLYSVKWHKDNVEFYRYLPDNRPNPAQKYYLEGTTSLDLKKSSMANVYLSKTDVQSEGIYRCEVSTDAPSFQTVKGEGEMRIYVFPSEKPRVEGARESYSPGEEIRLTCKAAPSRPATFLKWFINGKEAPVSFLIHHEPELAEGGLMKSSLGLKFIVENYHFINDATMTLHCEAVIYEAHTLLSDEKLIDQNISSNSDNLLDQISSDVDLEKGPTIRGGRINYRGDDTVDVNCTAPRSQPPSELHWYINDKEVRQEYLVKQPFVRYEDGKESSVLGLKFKVKQRYFPKGQPMRLRCTAAALSERNRLSSPIVQVLNRNQRRQISGLHIYEKSLAVSNSSWATKLQLHSIWTYLTVILPTLLAIMLRRL